MPLTICFVCAGFNIETHEIEARMQEIYQREPNVSNSDAIRAAGLLNPTQKLIAKLFPGKPHKNKHCSTCHANWDRDMATRDCKSFVLWLDLVYCESFHCIRVYTHIYSAVYIHAQAELRAHAHSHNALNLACLLTHTYCRSLLQHSTSSTSPATKTKQTRVET
jgi:hypothetical protein